MIYYKCGNPKHKKINKKGGEQMNSSTQERLRELRGNMSQEAVARDIGISTSAYIKYENGQRTPRDIIKKRIADYYNVDISALFID